MKIKVKLSLMVMAILDSISRLRNKTTSVKQGINQINVSVSNVDKMSHENNRNFESLKQETEKFNVVYFGKKKQKILLVDDDVIHLEMVKSVLQTEYDISTAKSGKEALGLLYQMVPQLILLDLIMPGMNGWDTYGRIKTISTLHDTPIAFFTVSNDPKDIQHAKEIGAVDYIKKPFQADDLLHRVGKILKNQNKIRGFPVQNGVIKKHHTEVQRIERMEEVV